MGLYTLLCPRFREFRVKAPMVTLTLPSQGVTAVFCYVITPSKRAKFSSAYLLFHLQTPLWSPWGSGHGEGAQVTFHPHNFVYTSQIPTSKFLLFLLTFSSPGLECSSHSPHQTLNHHLKTSPSPTSGRISWPLLSLRSPKTLSLPNHHAFSHFPICMTDVLKS